MRVLFVTSEAFPLMKTGGLGDVSGALPAALAEIGVDLRLLLPAYPEALAKVRQPRLIGRLGEVLGVGQTEVIEGEMPDSGMRVWLLDNPLYRRDGGPYQDANGRDWPDNALRFGLLSWAAAWLSADLSPIAWRPDVLHVHDWQAALAPAYVKVWLGRRPGSVLTIHNIAYQGNFPPDMVGRLELPPETYAIDGVEFHGRLGFLKAGCFYADRLTTVSPTYAREIQSGPAGCGLDGLLAHRGADLSGILNGVDYSVWNPASDPHLPRSFGHDLVGKPEVKRALQAELGLEARPDAPLFVIVSRLTHHKGTDLVLAAMPFLLHHGGQLAVLGTGEHHMEQAFQMLAQQHPGRVAAHIGYDEPLAHRMIAGGDILVMPSRSEPCGLTQMYALRYGTVPLVHYAGGLADTVVDVTYDTMLGGTATGLVFRHADLGGLQWCLDRAFGLYGHPDQWRRIRANGPRQDFSWRSSAERYHELYRSLAPQ